MATLLIATADGGVLRRVPLDPSRAYSLGRSERCDIPLEPASISRRHALLFRHAGIWCVADSGSARGLHTEEGSTRFAALTPERWVGVGPLVLWLLASNVTPARVEIDHSNETLNGAVTTKQDDSDCDESIVDGDTAGRLIAIETTAGHLVRLLDCELVDHATIGSDRSCTVPLSPTTELPDALAPLHAVLYREPSGWAVIAAVGVVTASGARYLRKRVDGETPVELGGYRVRTTVPHVLRNEEH